MQFQLEEKSIELEGALARVRQLEGRRSGSSESLERARSSMRGLEPLRLPDEPRIADTPRPRPSRIPRHKAAAPRPPSAHSLASAQSARGRSARDKPPPREPSHDKVRPRSFWNNWFNFKDTSRPGPEC